MLANNLNWWSNKKKKKKIIWARKRTSKKKYAGKWAILIKEANAADGAKINHEGNNGEFHSMLTQWKTKITVNR